MPKATQMNLKLDNQIGTLAKLCRELAHRGVNLLALSAPETSSRKGPVRLLVLWFFFVDCMLCRRPCVA